MALVPSTSVGGSGASAAAIYDFTVTGAAQAAIDTFVDNGGLGVGVALPGTYSALECYFIGRTDEAVTRSIVDITVNNDSSAIYDLQYNDSVNVTVSGNHSFSQTKWQCIVPGASASAGCAGQHNIVFAGYAATTFNKTGVSLGGYSDNAAAATNELHGASLAYRSTSAITRLKIIADTGAAKLIIGSRLIIYGR